MKRLLILLAFAGIGASAACGDDEGDDDTSGSDGGQPGADAGADSGPRGIQIENLGAACTSAADCMGPGTKNCLTEAVPGVLTFPGGYCTAACRTGAECGPNGACPVGELSSDPLIGPFVPIISGFLPIDCLQTCDKTKPETCSRSGFRCQTLADIAPAASFLGPAASQAYCLPPITLPEGGIPMFPMGTPPRDGGTPGNDAGSSTVVDAGGMDAGQSDGG